MFFEVTIVFLPAKFGLLKEMLFLGTEKEYYVFLLKEFWWSNLNDDNCFFSGASAPVSVLPHPDGHRNVPALQQFPLHLLPAKPVVRVPPEGGCNHFLQRSMLFPGITNSIRDISKYFQELIWVPKCDFFECPET